MSEISFVNFNEDEESIYPQVSLCFDAPFSDDKLKEVDVGINSSLYEQFLKGEIWDDRLANLDIENVTLTLEDYVLDTCVRSSFEDNCDEKGRISSQVYCSGTAKCLLFHYSNPQNIFEASLWINRSIL